MKKYKVLVGNKGYLVGDLEVAKEYAKRDSKVNFRAVVLDDNKVVARYERGEEK